MSQVACNGPRRRSVNRRDGDSVSDQARVQASEARHAADEAPWKVAKQGLAVTLFLVAILVLMQSLGIGFLHRKSPILDEVESAQQSLGIRLHSKNHAHRPPQNITLDWTVTATERSPDGVKKSVYLVNGLFPGPTVETRPGDDLTINVFNGLGDEGISIHWHGLQVPNAMDGAVGFTQCPIPPGKNFTYRFNIGEQHGTFWWHAHMQSQRGDGLYGGLIIHEPADSSRSTDQMTARYDQDVLLMVGDWFHRPATAVLEWYADPANYGNEPVPDSLLINGLGRYNCTLAVPARPVDCTQISEAMLGYVLDAPGPARMRLVNVGTIAGFTISVDGASLEAVAVDASTNVEARPARSIGVVYPGERVDVVLAWTDSGTIGPKMRIDLDDE
jgi:FtsP/CotA-like multicopper oxidase with cupredoxin domain